MNYFFEIDAVNVIRYYYEPHLKGVDDNFFFILESKEEAELLKKQFEELSLNYQIGDLKDFFDRFRENDLLVVNGNRIPDVYLSLSAKKRGGKVLYLQHGLYIPFMKRGFLFYLKKAGKALRYLSYSVQIGRLTNFKIIISLFQIHVLGRQRDYGKYNDAIKPDKSFVISNHWLNWHIEHYFLSSKKEEYSFMQNRDALFEVEKYSDSIVYCYQTLVEDGRIGAESMSKFYQNLLKHCQSVRKALIVKGHPRMSKKMKEYFHENGVKIVSNKLPLGDYTIGHYSTLLAIWPYLKSPVYFLEFKGHPVPKLLKDLGTVFDTFEAIPVKLSLGELDELSRKANEMYNYSNSYSLLSDFLTENKAEPIV